MRGFCINCMAECDAGARFCTKCGFDRAGYQPESHHLLPGTMLHGRYRIGRVLGEGGFGITYVGWDTLLNLKVAVKEFYMTGYVSRMNTYSPSVQVSAGTYGGAFQKNRDRFLDEARVLAKFAEEEGIVGIRDFFEENNTAYIVMSFLSGITLKEYIKKQGRLTWEQTFAILRPVLTSLSVVHRQGIIHRDISPDNIMLTVSGKVKLLDFGAAREYAAGENRSLSIILKPGYAPEEQYRSKGQQGPWTDVYALCATMYCCLTGHAPEESMERTFRDTLRPPHEVCDCPPDVSRVLMKGLSVYGQDRYSTVDALLAALRNPAGERTVPVKQPPVRSKPERKPKRALPWILAAACVLLIAALLIALPELSGRNEPKEEPGLSLTEKSDTPEAEEKPEQTEPEETTLTETKPPEDEPFEEVPQDAPAEEASGKEDSTEDEPVAEEPEEPEWQYDFPPLDPNSTYYADIYLGSRGTITVLLDQKAAPVTAANFVYLAESGFYDGLTFHRIIEGFMMQGGDPAGNGTGGSDTKIPGEFAANGYENPLTHTRGAISMARSSDYNSASSQFFIVHADSTFLDGQYAAFGYVVEGMDVVDTICEEAMPVDGNGTIPFAAQPMITFLTIRDSDSGPQPQLSEDKKPPAPEVHPLAGMDVEAEVLSIREETVYYVEQANAGVLTAVTVRRGVIATVDQYGQVWMIDVSSGTDDVPYSRLYYLDGSDLMFAFYDGADAHRCYFYEGQLIRWRHNPDSREKQVYTDHDLETSAEFREMEEWMLTDVEYYLAELEAMGYYA